MLFQIIFIYNTTIIILIITYYINTIKSNFGQVKIDNF